MFTRTKVRKVEMGWEVAKSSGDDTAIQNFSGYVEGLSITARRKVTSVLHHGREGADCCVARRNES